MFDYKEDWHRKFRRHRRPMANLRSDFFDPYSISKLFLWYDATRTDTITKDGSNYVSTWADLGPWGIDLTNSDGGTTTKPLYNSSGINSKPTIDFDGGDHVKTIDTLYDGEQVWGTPYYSNFDRRQTYIWISLATEASSSYKVWKLGSSSDHQVFWSRNTSYSNYPAYYINSNPSSAVEVYTPTYSGGTAPQNDTTNAHLWCYVHCSQVCERWAPTYEDIAGFLYIDNRYQPRNASTSLYYGNWVSEELFNLGVTSYKGKIGEVIVYNKLLSSLEIFRISTYLRSKWGTQAS